MKWEVASVGVMFICKQENCGHEQAAAVPLLVWVVFEC